MVTWWILTPMRHILHFRLKIGVEGRKMIWTAYRLRHFQKTPLDQESHSMSRWPNICNSCRYSWSEGYLGRDICSVGEFVPKDMSPIQSCKINRSSCECLPRQTWKIVHWMLSLYQLQIFFKSNCGTRQKEHWALPKMTYQTTRTGVSLRKDIYSSWRTSSTFIKYWNKA